MDVNVETASRQDTSFPCDCLGAGPDDDIDTGLDVRVTRFTDPDNLAVLQTDIGFHDPPVIQN